MHLHKMMAAVVVAVGIAMTACGHVTEAASNPTNVAAALPPQTDASGQPCTDGQATTVQSDLYGGNSAQQYAAQGYFESMYRPVVINNQPPEPPVADTQAPGYGMQQGYESQPGGDPDYYYDRKHHRHRRSKGRSAAIVIGSAAAGAGIGALAGGGKGAAIGAASGGTAGFIYDRLTHNH
jgi:hypothetical protein